MRYPCLGAYLGYVCTWEDQLLPWFETTFLGLWDDDGANRSRRDGMGVLLMRLWCVVCGVWCGVC